MATKARIVELIVGTVLLVTSAALYAVAYVTGADVPHQIIGPILGLGLYLMPTPTESKGMLNGKAN